MEKKKKKNFWVAGLILRGIKYNESQSSLKAAEEMGWHAVVKVDGRQVVVRLSDADKSPVTGCRAQISLHQARVTPPQSSIVLYEEAPGVYSAELPPDLAGAVPAELSLGKDNLLLERQILLNIRRD